MAGRFEFDPDKMFGTKAIRDLERMNVGLLGHSKLVDSLIGKNSIAAAMAESGKLAERFRPFPGLAFLGRAEALGVSQAHELFGAKHRSLFEALRVTQMNEALGMQPFKGLGLESAVELAFPKALRSLGLSNMDSLIGSTALLGNSWTKPSAILAAFAEPDLGGVLTWLEADEPEVAMASLLPEHDDVPREAPGIHIELNVTCAFCTQPILVLDSKLSFVGPKNGILHVSIVPLCAPCSRKANQDPSYYEGMVDRLNAPRVRVLDGGGESDGVRRGQLRLVRDDEGEDE